MALYGKIQRMLSSHYFARVVKRTASVLSVMGVVAFTGNANAFCFAEAANRYELNEYVLRAIAAHESRMNPALQVENTNGSKDIGLMGINTIHLRRGERLANAGMTPSMLLDPCTNVMTGAYLLRLKTNRFGNTWQAVGAYHSTTDHYNLVYQNKIWLALQKVMQQAQDRSASNAAPLKY